MHYIF